MAEKVNAKKKIDTIILCVALAVFVISTILGGVCCANYLKEANAGYVEVKAPIVRYEVQDVLNSHIKYVLFYEYVAEDGYKYTGKLDDFISNKEYAENQIGRSVTIYVSDKLHKQRRDLDFSPTTTIVFFVISGISLIVSIFFIVQLKTNSQNKNNKENSRQRYNKNAKFKYR